ncbi:MAG: Ppx/GppA family phosphatase [Rhodobacter sp.]|uniref:Ppx/GppA phosphatase family protein n=1 Tax=Pararhodobacter sp. TaxID=2127056 RepID=UPI001DCB0519|nr:Ppx/GppA phosphatase family protein [Pararhodobacter sp.]MCB1344598.1 Ppx/GppA family phosphatase [Paracoccaceae bacterium]MCB1408503.1 Ppx/GppA family phosphatase [Paracoccaceae bacterium]MCC0073081.1 Ppx/GppA family phosphatase [Rhodobacter sp.]HPD92812.1 Ppx/GppA phosphatase family protein [Pararhodobacter sp.]
MTPERPAGAAAHPKSSRPPRQGRTPGGPEPKRQTMPSDGGLYAALDLGTNSCRMLIARPKGAQFEVIDSFSRAVELGTGLESTGRLGHGPMARTVQALRICRRKLDDHAVLRMRLVATEACRRARNSAEFIRKIQRETGLRLEIIPAEEEARLAVISCAPLVAPETEQLLVIDIGGGSTELVWLDLSEVPPEERRASILTVKLGLAAVGTAMPRPGQSRVVDWISVPLGVATLREQFTDVEDDAARFALMSWHFEEQLHSFSPYENPAPREGFQIIGTSGTVTTVAASYLGLKRYDRNKVDGLTMTSAQIDKVIHDYLALGPEGRRTDPRIGRERHGLIMSGAAILQALMRVWPTDVMSVADRGLREGLLYAQMSRDGVLDGM